MQDDLDAALARVAQVFERRLDAIASEVTERSRTEIEEWRDIDAPEIWEVVRSVTRAARAAQADALRRGRSLPETVPPADVEAASLAARAGISLTSALKSYRIGHRVAWDGWLDAIEEADFDPGFRQRIVRAVSRFVIAYDDRSVELFSAEFNRVADRELGGGRTTLARVRDLLEGLTDDAAGLDLEPGAVQLGIVASGAAAARSVNRLAGALRRTAFAVAVADDLRWAWLGGRALDEAGWAALRRFQPDEGVRLALGDPAPGVAGFRRTHRQAGEAHLVGSRLARGLTFYRDVALEAMALRDERWASDFVAGRLGPLGDGARGDELRTTLRTYFASSQNASAAAAALGVHEQTVARRIKAIEEVLGEPVNSQRVELELALRVEPLLVRAVDSEPGL